MYSMSIEDSPFFMHCIRLDNFFMLCCVCLPVWDLLPSNTTSTLSLSLFLSCISSFFLGTTIYLSDTIFQSNHAFHKLLSYSLDIITDTMR